VAYNRGALVMRLLAREAGPEGFRERLRGLLASHAFRVSGVADFVEAVGSAELARYYAATTRLPDLHLEEVVAGAGTLRARVRCDDAAWPGGRVPVRIATAGGVHEAEVLVRDGEGELAWEGEGEPIRVEVDPERLYLDPVRSNSVWER